MDSWAILSRGRSFIIPIATPVHPSTTHRKLKKAASMTDFLAEREFEYMTGATAFAVSWNQLINSKAQTRRRHIPANIYASSIKRKWEGRCYSFSHIPEKKAKVRFSLFLSLFFIAEIKQNRPFSTNTRELSSLTFSSEKIRFILSISLKRNPFYS